MVAEGEGGGGSSGVGGWGWEAGQWWGAGGLNQTVKDKDSCELCTTGWSEIYHSWLHKQTGTEWRKGRASFTAGNYGWPTGEEGAQVHSQVLKKNPEASENVTKTYKHDITVPVWARRLWSLNSRGFIKETWNVEFVVITSSRWDSFCCHWLSLERTALTAGARRIRLSGRVQCCLCFWCQHKMGSGGSDLTWGSRKQSRLSLR